MKSIFWPSPICELGNNEVKILGSWHAGVIETHRGHLRAIRWMPWAKRISRLGIWWDRHRRTLPIDHCCLYWHRPWFQSKVVALDYVRSGPQTSVATFHAAVCLLDEVARSSSSLAAVCHVTNQRISERLLQRWGWERHCLNWSGRHYIRRYYDGYSN